MLDFQRHTANVWLSLRQAGDRQEISQTIYENPQLFADAAAILRTYLTLQQPPNPDAPSQDGRIDIERARQIGRYFANLGEMVVHSNKVGADSKTCQEGAAIIAACMGVDISEE